MYFQGVNLSNIVKDISLYSGESGAPTEHAVVQAVNGVKASLSVEPTDYDSLKIHLDKLKTECDIDLARRCMAGKYDTYPTLLKAGEVCRTIPDLLKQCLVTMASLFNGHPDLLNKQGLVFLCNLLKENNSEIVSLTLKVVRLACTKHEQNRQDFVAEDLIQLVKTVLLNHKKNAAVVKEACSVLRTLTLDDDIRVPFGKAHEHAKMIVMEADALKAILNLCQGKPSKYIPLYMYFHIGAIKDKILVLHMCIYIY